MRISVIIPSFNRAHTLPRAIESVLRQDSAADEIIVVNDGSTDNSAEVLNHYSTVKSIYQPNKGVSSARNAGIQAASHDWIALLDSDDEWLPEKLALIRQSQLDNPAIRLLHSDEIWIRNGTRVNPMNKHHKYGGEIFHHCLPLCVISPSAVVMHRSLLEQCGLFDENLPACEDYDLWLRICHRFPVLYIEQPLIKKYGGHEDQLSRLHWGMDRFRILAMHRLMQQPTLTTEQQQLTRTMLIKKLRILIKGAIKHDNQLILNEYQPLLEQYETGLVTC